jgi:hypothetical protein
MAFVIPGGGSYSIVVSEAVAGAGCPAYSVLVESNESCVVPVDLLDFGVK